MIKGHRWLVGWQVWFERGGDDYLNQPWGNGGNIEKTIEILRKRWKRCGNYENIEETQTQNDGNIEEEKNKQNYENSVTTMKIL